MKLKEGLTPRQELLADCAAVPGTTAADAARKAGYNEVSGWKTLQRPDVKAALAHRRAKQLDGELAIETIARDIVLKSLYQDPDPQFALAALVASRKLRHDYPDADRAAQEREATRTDALAVLVSAMWVGARLGSKLQDFPAVCAARLNKLPMTSRVQKHITPRPSWKKLRDLLGG